MADLVTNGTAATITNSGAPATANGPTLFTFSGTRGPLNKNAVLSIYSRSDTANYALTHQQHSFGRFQINFVSGDSWYYIIESNGCTVDLAAVDI